MTKLILMIDSLVPSLHHSIIELELEKQSLLAVLMSLRCFHTFD